MSETSTTPKPAGHTAGPWKTYFDDYSRIVPGWQVKARDEVETPIAIVPEPYGGKKVKGRSPWQEANARLIAAAPELLAACKDEDAMLSNLLGDIKAGRPLNGSRMEEGLRMRRDAIRAAILKAEGGGK